MLESRIINTLEFFDLQDIPLTAFEIHKYLLNDAAHVLAHLDGSWEVVNPVENTGLPISLATVQSVLSALLSGPAAAVKTFRGYYFLAARSNDFVLRRLENYQYAVRRERRIKRYGSYIRHIPFVRGVGLVGSQALGQYRTASDIDILVFVDPNFIWLARVMLTTYFQVLGLRRHGRYVADRFCLNHYIAGAKQLRRDRNLYTAGEYAKMRPLYPSSVLEQFKSNNGPWIRLFFPHTSTRPVAEIISIIQSTLEKILDNSFGRAIDRWLKRSLLGRIKQDSFVVVEDDELAFHPHNRKAGLFAAFFKRQQHDNRESV